MKTIATDVSNEVHQQIKDLAWYTRKSMNAVFKEAVMSYLASHKDLVKKAQGIAQECPEVEISGKKKAD